MNLVKTEQFGKLSLHVYNDNGETYLTREQIGTALEYSNPQQAIAKIHDKNKDRLDALSTVTKLGTVEGGRKVKRSTIAYTLRGVMEICRLSRQPKADAFIDKVWDIMEAIHRGDLTAQRNAPAVSLALPEGLTYKQTVFLSRLAPLAEEDGYIRLSLARMVQVFDLSESMIARKLKGLQKAGYITIEKGKCPECGTVNRCRYNLPTRAYADLGLIDHMDAKNIPM
jgi:prophage antirepressor-like protein